MELLTEAQIAQNYRAMLDSVWLINAVVSDEYMQAEHISARKDAVQRNVQHLEMMRTKDYWTTEDMTAVDAAIAVGKTYVG